MPNYRGYAIKVLSLTQNGRTMRFERSDNPGVVLEVDLMKDDDVLFLPEPQVEHRVDAEGYLYLSEAYIQAHSLPQVTHPKYPPGFAIRNPPQGGEPTSMPNEKEEEEDIEIPYPRR